MFSFSKRKREKNGHFLFVFLSEMYLLFLKNNKGHQNHNTISKYAKWEHINSSVLCTPTVRNSVCELFSVRYVRICVHGHKHFNRNEEFCFRCSECICVLYPRHSLQYINVAYFRVFFRSLLTYLCTYQRSVMNQFLAAHKQTWIQVLQQYWLIHSFVLTITLIYI